MSKRRARYARNWWNAKRTFWYILTGYPTSAKAKAWLVTAMAVFTTVRAGAAS